MSSSTTPPTNPRTNIPFGQSGQQSPAQNPTQGPTQQAVAGMFGSLGNWGATPTAPGTLPSYAGPSGSPYGPGPSYGPQLPPGWNNPNSIPGQAPPWGGAYPPSQYPMSARSPAGPGYPQGLPPMPSSYPHGQENWNWMWGPQGRNLSGNYYPGPGVYGAWQTQQNPPYPELLLPHNRAAARTYQEMVSAGMSWDDVTNQMAKDKLLSFYGNPTPGGLRHDPFLDPASAEQAAQMEGLDEFGFTKSGRLPIWQIAPDMQFMAEKRAAERNQRLGTQALGALQQGLANLESYRPGGASGLLSGYYQGMANTYLGMRQTAPDLLFQYDIHMGTVANRDARRAATFGLIGQGISGIGQGAGAYLGSMGGGSGGGGGGGSNVNRSSSPNIGAMFSASGSTVLPGSTHGRKVRTMTSAEQEEFDKEALKTLGSKGIGAAAGMIASYYSGGMSGGEVTNLVEGDAYNAFSATMGDEEDIEVGRGHQMGGSVPAEELFGASGKTVQPDSDGTQITVAEGGEPEHIIPESQKHAFAEEVQRQRGEPSTPGPQAPQAEQAPEAPRSVTPAPPTPSMQSFANSLVQREGMEPVDAMEFTYGSVADTVGMQDFLDTVNQQLDAMMVA